MSKRGHKFATAWGELREIPGFLPGRRFNARPRAEEFGARSEELQRFNFELQELWFVTCVQCTFVPICQSYTSG